MSVACSVAGHELASALTFAYCQVACLEKPGLPLKTGPSMPTQSFPPRHSDIGRKEDLYTHTPEWLVSRILACCAPCSAALHIIHQPTAGRRMSVLANMRHGVIQGCPSACASCCVELRLSGCCLEKLQAHSPRPAHRANFCSTKCRAAL